MAELKNSNNKEKLELMIRKIIKNEIKKNLKPILQEMVENKVNKILVEQIFPKLLSNQNKPSLIESFKEDKPKTNFNREQEKKIAREKLLEKLGVNENSTLQMIYEDVEPAALPSSPPIEGMYMDTDDGGVDEDVIFSLMNRR